MTERWVINASPLILLGKAGQLAWVPRLGAVVVPRPVADEILAGAEDDPARVWLEQGEGQSLIKPGGAVPPELAAWDLGAGETSVLAWAVNAPGYEAVLDDAAARRCAQVYRVPVRSTLGLVVLAKKRGFIAECRPVFEQLTASGLFVTAALLEQAARAAGE